MHLCSLSQWIFQSRLHTINDYENKTLELLWIEQKKNSFYSISQYVMFPHDVCFQLQESPFLFLHYFLTFLSIIICSHKKYEES